MQNRNKSKSGLTPATVKPQKVVNSSVSTGCITCHSSVIKSSSHKFLHSLPVDPKAKQEFIHPVKVSKCMPNKAYSTFDAKNSVCDTNNAVLHTKNEELHTELKFKIGSYANPLLNPVKRRHGPAKVKQSIYCPSKAMRGQVFESLHPFNAEQIIANTGRVAKHPLWKESEITAKNAEGKLDTFGQASFVVNSGLEKRTAEEAKLKSGTNRFLGKTMTEKQLLDRSACKVIEAKCLLNSMKATPGTSASNGYSTVDESKKLSTTCSTALSTSISALTKPCDEYFLKNIIE